MLTAVERIRAPAGVWQSGKILSVSDTPFDFFQEKIRVYVK
jgi:hypothetical protein